MRYVYILQSLADTEHFYTGITDDLKARLSTHNSGAVTYTAKHRPWRIKSYIAFTDQERAFAFEKYLKAASGWAFAKSVFDGRGGARHLRHLQPVKPHKCPDLPPKSRFSSAIFLQS